MSAVPPSFTPLTSFSTLAQQPILTTGLPGSELDGEFLRASDSINQIKDRLSEVQRDDGKLRNGVVSTESLSDDVIDMFISSGARPITWAVGISIAVGDLVSNPPGTPGTYLCIIAHTSSALFANDLAKWALIAAPPIVGFLYTNTFTGNGATTVFTLTQTPASKDNTQVYINGIYQPKASYTLNGLLLTITPAPANGSSIEVSIGVPSTSNIVTVADGAISTAKLADNSVTTDKILDSSITSAKVGIYAIGNLNIQPSAITSDKISPSAVTSAKIAQFSITSDKIADESVSTSKLTPLSVVGDKIASNTISTAKLQDNSVTTAKIADSSIVTSKIIDGSITEAKIVDNAVSSAKIPTSAITSSKIASASVITDKIADASITAAKLNGAQTGTAPVFGVRAFVVFDATRNAAGASDLLTTPRFIISSGNVSSVTRTAQGSFTVAFNTALPNANYGYFGSSVDQGSDEIMLYRPIAGSKTTASFQFDTLRRDGTNRDPQEATISFIV